MEDVIRLTRQIEVEDKKGDHTVNRAPATKTYKYSELQELQSKLTLVASEHQKANKEMIKRFNDVSVYKNIRTQLIIWSVKCKYRFTYVMKPLFWRDYSLLTYFSKIRNILVLVLSTMNYFNILLVDEGCGSNSGSSIH